MSEFERKLNRIRGWIDEKKLDALYLQRVSSFAWATCGAVSHVNIASTDGTASLLITQDKQYLFTNNIEAPRLEKEENLLGQGWEFNVTPWHANQNAFGKYINGMNVGADGSIAGSVDISTELARLRASLSPEEGLRLRELGQHCALAMDAAIRAIHPGMTEHEIAGKLAGEVEARGVKVTVNLVATDERIFEYRHPPPTFKKLASYAMLVLCGRQSGLVCSVTRFIHFGRLPREIEQKSESVARIDATMIRATRPGCLLGDVFQAGVDEYTRAGYPDEWHKHHQGGPAGYEPREYFAYPGSSDQVSVGQAYAWNPSITGSKSEDTILVGRNENEILTKIHGWPTIDVDGIERPAILVI